MQFRYSTQYARFGRAVYGFKDSEHTFLERPTLIRDTPRLVFLSALYKYMTPVFPNPSAHQIVTEQW